MKSESEILGIDISSYVRWCLRTGLYLKDLNTFIHSKSGENKTLALAVKQGIENVLIDEAKARRVARAHNLKFQRKAVQKFLRVGKREITAITGQHVVWRREGYEGDKGGVMPAVLRP